MATTVPEPTDSGRKVSRMSRPPTRWMSETGGARGPDYARMFRELAAGGQDVHGEAHYLDGLLARHPDAGRRPLRVLDAGCGTGRVAIELARRGHTVTGLDVDDSMVAEARRDAQQAGVDVRLEVGDLLDVADLVGDAGPFDLVAMAGNVVVYLATGTEPDVVAALAGQLAAGGLLVAGFSADRHVAPDHYDRWCTDAGLAPVVRHSSWDGDPWTTGDGYVVAVHRR